MGLFVEITNVSGGSRAVYNSEMNQVDVADGSTVLVTRDQAGTAPHWRIAKEGEDITLMHIRDRAGHIEVYDLGSGMLAQPSNWSDGSDVPEPDDAGGGVILDGPPAPTLAEPVPVDTDGMEGN